MSQQQQQQSAAITAAVESGNERLQQELHGLRQLQQQQQQQLTRLDQRLTVVEQQQQQQQQRGNGTEAEGAATWAAETVGDASNLAKVGHLLVVSPLKDAPPITAEQAAAAVGVPLTQVSKHDNLQAAYFVSMGTAAAAGHKVQQCRSSGVGGLLVRREKTALGGARTFLVTAIKDRVNAESQRLGLGVTAYAATNASNVLLTMGTVRDASAGRATSVPYPMWRHGRKSYARGAGGKWEKSAEGLEKVVQYLSEVLPSLSPAAAAAAAAAAATTAVNSASVSSSSAVAAAAAAATATPTATAAQPAAMGAVTPIYAPRPQEGHNGDTPAALAAGVSPLCPSCGRGA